MHEHQNWPSWHRPRACLALPRLRQLARPCALAACASARAPASSPAPARLPPCAPVPHANAPRTPVSCRIVACSVLYRNTAPAFGLCYHNTICVLRYKRPVFKPASLTILSAYCNTILPYILQYNPRLTNCIAIQFPSLKYKLGSSKFPNFCTKIFFSFFLKKKNFFIISSNWKNHQKSLKIIFFFHFFPEYTNNF